MPGKELVEKDPLTVWRENKEAIIADKEKFIQGLYKEAHDIDNQITTIEGQIVNMRKEMDNIILKAKVEAELLQWLFAMGAAGATLAFLKEHTVTEAAQLAAEGLPL